MYASSTNSLTKLMETEEMMNGDLGSKTWRSDDLLIVL